MPSRLIRSTTHLQLLLSTLESGPFPLRMEWWQTSDRSREQNRLMWKWAQEVADQSGDVDQNDVQARWKLEIGVPILRAEDADFRDLYDEAIRPLPYETKIRIMRDFDFPVTSRMSVKQMTTFLNNVAFDCAENGFDLTQAEAA